MAIFGFGCAAKAPVVDAGKSASSGQLATPNATSISLSNTKYEADAASYTWNVKAVPIKSVVFGSSDLDVSPAQPVQSITLDLKQLKAGDQILASITIESKDKNGPTFTTTSSDIGMDKGQDIRKLVAPVEALGAVHDETVLAKGIGAFPSLIVHLN